MRSISPCSALWLPLALALTGCLTTGGQLCDGEVASSGAALTAVASFGSNPGNLEMFLYAPASMPPNAPVVVAMHGCTQSASAYVGAGWNALADKEKFYVIYPQQNSTNNAESCFDWYGAADLARGQGEALSIKQMVDSVKSRYSVDSSRVYVTGLSAGGAYVEVMLATYPDVFAAGAVMSGLPYGCAESTTDAYSCMNPGKTESAAAWTSDAKAGYPGYSGRWPRVSIWHGDSDYTVAPANAVDSVTQWAGVLGVDTSSPTTTTVGKATHYEYKDASGSVLVERWSISGMGHGTAIDPSNGCGTAGAYILDEGICSTTWAWKFFQGGAAATTGPTGPTGGSDAGVDAGAPGSGLDAGSTTPTPTPTSDGGTASPTTPTTPTTTTTKGGCH